jgi:hypothetical protein
MLVRYRTNSSCTLQNFKDDINNIILGNITSVNDLSAGADKVNTVIYGTYPTGKYARVNGTSFTYSKQHNTESTYTHYFRLTFDSVGISQVALAQGYTSGTDTLLNSYSISAISYPTEYSAARDKSTIDIIVSAKSISIMSSTFIGANKIAICDLGHTGVTRQYTDSMLMAAVNCSSQGGGLAVYCPYTYIFDTSSYGVLSMGTSTVTSDRKTGGPNITTIFENPHFALFQSPALLYGIFKIATQTFPASQQVIYKDASNLYRLSINDNSFLVD